jgi:hypothetical protein
VKDIFTIYNVLIFVVAVLGMMHRRYVVRLIVLVVTFSSCCWLTYIDSSVRTLRQQRGHLNMFLGEPYEDLCRHLAKLSVDNPKELNKLVQILSQEENVDIFCWAWLDDSEDFSVFVKQLISKGSITNQVINVSERPRF